MLDTNSLQAGLDKRLSSDFSGMVVLYGMVIEEEKGGGATTCDNADAPRRIFFLSNSKFARIEDRREEETMTCDDARYAISHLFYGE